MNRTIIIYDKDGNVLGRHTSFYTNPQKDGDKFTNEAAYYYYQLDSVCRIEIIYEYPFNPDNPDL